MTSAAEQERQQRIAASRVETAIALMKGWRWWHVTYHNFTMRIVLSNDSPRPYSHDTGIKVALLGREPTEEEFLNSSRTGMDGLPSWTWDERSAESLEQEIFYPHGKTKESPEKIINRYATTLLSLMGVDVTKQYTPVEWVNIMRNKTPMMVAQAYLAARNKKPWGIE